ncbi:uncharacterized protein B0H64DRAFT_405375 [Chaetomium fimeti]|jgi:hypothetical protein|uniref:Infection structure specific protein n=1 Tax=Chaetomium fimeti TaxID=1854472 RepID=A0AAE0HDR6_9PEZI|nr:hypothetical protein B0H64DRAFT_405375 [Chaetomium fimeti]
MQTPALITLVLAASVSAVAHPGPAVTGAPLMARDEAECAKGAASIASNMPPVPTGALGSWVAEHDAFQIVQSALDEGNRIDNGDELCQAVTSSPTPPESLSSSWSSYSSRLNSWQSSAAPTISSVAAQCTDNGPAGILGAGLELALATDVPQCTNAVNRYNKALENAAAGSPRYLSAVAGVAGLAAAVMLF